MIIKKIKPLFNAIVTTMDTYTEEELKVGGIIDSSKINLPVKEYQTVVAVGPTVRNIEVGDIVKINPARYKVRDFKEEPQGNANSLRNSLVKTVPSYQFKYIKIDGVNHLLLADSDIEFIVEEYEDEPPQSDIIIPNHDIVTI